MKNSKFKNDVNIKILIFCTLVFMIALTACNKENTAMPTDTNPNANQNGTRYKDLVFNDVLTTKEVQYGNATTQAGVDTDLKMNVYEPNNDTETNRPLILLAHGGGYVAGAKEDFDELATSFAKAGYVAATIQYRLMDGDEPDLKRAVMDAVHDMRAAVRFFNVNSSTYKIDVSNVFIGGFSAGAVTALHYAYFDETNFSSAPTELIDYLNSNGGLSGSSGNAGANDQVKGVINIAGGLFRANWIDANEPLLISVHGGADIDVYCDKDPQSASDPNGDFTEGSCLIHPEADAVGITNQLIKIENGDHGAFFACDDCVEKIRAFIFQNL